MSSPRYFLLIFLFYLLYCLFFFINNSLAFPVSIYLLQCPFISSVQYILFPAPVSPHLPFSLFLCAIPSSIFHFSFLFYAGAFPYLYFTFPLFSALISMYLYFSPPVIILYFLQFLLCSYISYFS